jgi:hypothetical protein
MTLYYLLLLKKVLTSYTYSRVGAGAGTARAGAALKFSPGAGAA